MVCHFKFKLLQKCSVKNVLCLIIFIFGGVYLHLSLMRDIAMFIDDINNIINNIEPQQKSSDSSGTKHILIWNSDMIYMKELFPKCNCSVSNCIFTENKQRMIYGYTRFDAVLFSENQLGNLKDLPLSIPATRARSQIYIYTSFESSANFPACEVFNDDFFNWTFTYRLDSDIVWNYFVVRNISGDIIAPSDNVKWDETKYPVNYKVKAIFRGRKKAAAWIVSNCKADNLRSDYLTKLQEHFYHLGLTLDVFGKCTNKPCDNNDCEEMLRNNYYFYMAFENSFADDYVTEKVLHGYDNYVVPIVYGGANYSRFLPPGSYINAREFHPYNLAYAIYIAIHNTKTYEEFFYWTNLYTFDSNPKNYHPLCDLCKELNSKRAEYAPAKKKFRLWWNTLDGMKWCLPMEFWNETSKINIDSTFVYKNVY